MYVRGEGVSRDYSQALKWFRRSAELGNPQAQMSLGLLYFNGWGVAKDRDEAVKWCRKAADQGDEQAALVLSSMIKHTKGRETAEEKVAVK
jgi:TPR repeat protein